MSFSAPHMLFAWSGHFTAGPGAAVIDEFAGSLRFAGPGVDTVNNQEVAELMWTTFSNFVADPRSGLPGFARFDHAKWNKIGVDGKYADPNNSTDVIPSNALSGPLIARYPTQIACCTTWTTDFARGRASKGRTFWPTAFQVTSATNMRLPVDVATDFAQWGLDLIRGLNRTLVTNAAQTPNDSGLPSAGGATGPVASVMSNIGTGRTAAINGCRVGNRLDIQRRRGAGLPETYVQRPA